MGGKKAMKSILIANKFPYKRISLIMEAAETNLVGNRCRYGALSSRCSKQLLLIRLGTVERHKASHSMKRYRLGYRLWLVSDHLKSVGSQKREQYIS